MTFTYTPRTAEALAARAGQKFDGEVSPTAVLHFLQPAFVETRRAYIACISCGHWRAWHCTKRKLKPGQVPTHAKWQGFVDDEGQIQSCSHTLENAQAYACSSSACAVVLGTGDDEHFCECPKFISPNAKKRTAKPHTPALPSGIKRSGLFSHEALLCAHENYLREQATLATPLVDKVAVLLEVASEVDLTALSTAQIAEFTGMSPSWVRKTLRAAGLIAPATPRRTTTFTTGGSQ